MTNINKQFGFTFVELVIVIVILGIIAAVAAPRFLNIKSEARSAALDEIASQVESSIRLAQIKARAKGLRPVASNPAGSEQLGFVVDFGFGSAEVDWRNLCPESRAEAGDALTFLAFLNLPPDDEIQTRFDNQYTLIGYELPVSGRPTDQGCYLIYDSFGLPDCTVTVVNEDC